MTTTIEISKEEMIKIIQSWLSEKQTEQLKIKVPKVVDVVTECVHCGCVNYNVSIPFQVTLEE